MPKGLAPPRPSAPVCRSMSASEIARNVKTFETWSSYHGCEQVAFSDLPSSLKSDVLSVFNVTGKLPANLVNKASNLYKRIEKLSPGLLKFLLDANEQSPNLFTGPSVKNVDECFTDLCAVFLAWNQLVRMKKSMERWSEADFASNVYTLLRSPAMRESSYRNQCSLQLPQHLSTSKPIPIPSRRIISTKTIVPDGAMFIRSASLQAASRTRGSAYKRINEHPSTKRTCGYDGEGTFRYQATPAARPQATPMFECAGVFIEDKKPSCDSLEHAYRQNRMACCSSLRQLNSLGIEVPVFGLVWADGKVKAHVDWCFREEKLTKILSAAYPGPNAIEEYVNESLSDASRSTVSQPQYDASDFFEWNLHKPADIIAVYLVLRNMDKWISHGFRDRVLSGVEACADAVTEKDKPYKPWRREDSALKVLRSSSLSNSENTASPRTSDASSIGGLPLAPKDVSKPTKKPVQAPPVNRRSTRNMAQNR